ncbi:hypothetical protein [Sporomusa aerivorans]|uniref:hypothetical protein n=1 Tax=Sporomusa aerivorans TaxID=204936 RepID=UPI00352B3969
MGEKERVEIKSVPFFPANCKYTLLDDAYTGGGGFLNGDYLIPHVRETPDKYGRRKALSYYANYVKAVINALVDPVFRKVAARNWEGQGTDSAMFSKFQNDVDGKGTKIQRFMKRALKKAKLHGVCFIVVDNVPDQPPNKGEAIEKRAFPYAYLVFPKQVKAYECDKAGVLTSITYEIYARRASGAAVSYTTERWTWTTTSWEREAEGETVETEHKLGVVPVIPLFGTDADEGDMQPIGDMLSIARINLAIFNLCSELRELLRNQAFATLCYPVTDNAGFDELNKIVTGTENALGYDGLASTSPSYIAPPAEQAILLQDEIKRLVEEIYRIASLTSVVGVQQKNSGVAKEWDFENTNQALADLAENCQDAEMKMAFLFEKWTNSTIGYSCVYPDDFGIVDVAEALDDVTKALDLQIGGLFQKEVKKKAVEVYLAHLPEDRFDAVMEDIDQQDEEVQQAVGFEGAPE